MSPGPNAIAVHGPRSHVAAIKAVRMKQRINAGQRPLAIGLGVGEVNRQGGGVALGDLPRRCGGADTKN